MPWSWSLAASVTSNGREEASEEEEEESTSSEEEAEEAPVVARPRPKAIKTKPTPPRASASSIG